MLEKIGRHLHRAIIPKIYREKKTGKFRVILPFELYTRADRAHPPRKIPR
jgi:hypothetical protein